LPPGRHGRYPTAIDDLGLESRKKIQRGPGIARLGDKGAARQKKGEGGRRREEERGERESLLFAPSAERHSVMLQLSNAVSCSKHRRRELTQRPLGILVLYCPKTLVSQVILLQFLVLSPKFEDPPDYVVAVPLQEGIKRIPLFCSDRGRHSCSCHLARGESHTRPRLATPFAAVMFFPLLPFCPPPCTTKMELDRVTCTGHPRQPVYWWLASVHSRRRPHRRPLIKPSPAEFRVIWRCSVSEIEGLVIHCGAAAPRQERSERS